LCISLVINTFKIFEHREHVKKRPLWGRIRGSSNKKPAM
jgi:hypothetical protein